jgi:antitoxin YefM
MMSLQEYQQLRETTHLLRSPANARRLVSAVESLAQQKGNVRTLKRSE